MNKFILGFVSGIIFTALSVVVYKEGPLRAECTKAGEDYRLMTYNSKVIVCKNDKGKLTIPR